MASRWNRTVVAALRLTLWLMWLMTSMPTSLISMQVSLSLSFPFLFGGDGYVFAHVHDGVERSYIDLLNSLDRVQVPFRCICDNGEPSDISLLP
jgi:hypothetical protein